MKSVQRGVTLIELAVVLVIVAILFSQAGPMFTAWMQNVQVRTAAESIQNGLQLARAEAIRRNRSVMFWLTAANGTQQADWLVGCSSPSGAGGEQELPGECPGPLNTLAVPGAYNWIQRQTAAAQQTNAPTVTTTPALSNVVTFNSVGLVTPNLDGSASIQKILVQSPNFTGATARPLYVTISAGDIRMCDPNLSVTNDPRGCQ